MNLDIRTTDFLRFQGVPYRKLREVNFRVLQEQVPACYGFFYDECNFDFL